MAHVTLIVGDYGPYSHLLPIVGHAGDQTLLFVDRHTSEADCERALAALHADSVDTYAVAS